MDIKRVYGFGCMSKIFYRHMCASYACLNTVLLKFGLRIKNVRNGQIKGLTSLISIMFSKDIKIMRYTYSNWIGLFKFVFLWQIAKKNEKTRKWEKRKNDVRTQSEGSSKRNRFFKLSTLASPFLDLHITLVGLLITKTTNIKLVVLIILKHLILFIVTCKCVFKLLTIFL